MHKHIGVVVLRNLDHHRRVRLVERVSRLECNHVLPRLLGADLARRLARDPIAGGKLSRPHATANVELVALVVNVLVCGVLLALRSVTLEGLATAVGDPLRLDLDHSAGAKLGACQQHIVTNGNVLAVRVKHDGKTKELALREAVLFYNSVVLRLRHESGQRRKAADGEELKVAHLALVKLERLCCQVCIRLGLGHDEIHEDAAVGSPFACNARVDATLCLQTTNKASRALALVDLDGDARVSVTKRLPHVHVGSLRPNKLGRVRKVRAIKLNSAKALECVAVDGLNGHVRDEKAAVERNIRHIVL
eukprot:Opistho-2@82765